jgi:hypothetical protein
VISPLCTSSLGKSGTPVWRFEGREYLFRRERVTKLDAQIKALSDAGVVVYLILLAYESGESKRDAIALHPKYERHATENHLAAFNTESAEGRAYLRAVIEFLAHRYSGSESAHGRVWGYIVGNEANAHWWWYNLGRASLETVARDYESAVRLAHDAIRTESENARVYISLEHHWTIRYPPADAEQAVAGRNFLEEFARRSRELGDFDWHVAYHPYPENLRDCRFWRTRAPLLRSTPLRITPKNIEVLPRLSREAGNALSWSAEAGDPVRTRLSHPRRCGRRARSGRRFCRRAGTKYPVCRESTRSFIIVTSIICRKD